MANEPENSYSEINMSQIRVGGGIAGLLFALGTVYIFVVGVPVIRAFFGWSVAAGFAISLGLYLFRKLRPAGHDDGHLGLDAISTTSVNPPDTRRQPRGFMNSLVTMVSPTGI